MSSAFRKVDSSQIGAWGMAYEQLRNESPSVDTGAFCTGAEWGAGWVFAIVGMAQAIRDQKFCQRCDGELDGHMCCDGRW